MTNVSALSDLLKPVDVGSMRFYPVNNRINQVANDDEACSTPVEVAEVQSRLF
jgi:putative SOS response-associated peptidase YedK